MKKAQAQDDNLLNGRPVRRMPPLSQALRAAFGHPHPPAPGQLQIATMGRMAMAPEESDVWHAHADLWELCVQSAGAVVEHFGGVPFEMRPGDVALFPAGQLHGCINRQSATVYQYVLHFAVNRVPRVERNPRLRPPPGRPLCRLDATELLWFEQLFHQLWWEETTRRPEFEALEDLLLKQIFLGLERTLAGGSAGPRMRETPSAEVVRFITCVGETLARPNPLLEAAARLGLNYDSLRHRFRRETGLAPKRFLLELRIQRAKQLLLISRLSVKEIAATVGFSDAHHFSRCFTERMGLSPLHWRRHPRLCSYPPSA
jgi:AraC-like DNA-binding protein/quercetin dioxygenase-like cupin family protein